MKSRVRCVGVVSVASIALAIAALSAPSASFASLINLDFTTADDFSTALVNGQAVSNPNAFSNLVTIETMGGHHRGAAIFDSTPNGPNTAGPAQDLLVDLGNILILQSNSFSSQTAPGVFDVPADETKGGTVLFNFHHTVSLQSIDVIGIDTPAEGINFILTDANGFMRKYIVPSMWTKNKVITPSAAGYGTLDLTSLDPQAGEGGTFATAVQDNNFNPDLVVKMEAEFMGSGGVDNFKLLPEPATMAILLAGLPMILRRRR